MSSETMPNTPPNDPTRSADSSPQQSWLRGSHRRGLCTNQVNGPPSKLIGFLSVMSLGLFLLMGIGPPQGKESTIDLAPVTTLGGSRPGDGLICLRMDFAIATDSSGRYYVPSCERGKLLVFQPDGTLLTQFGRYGQGPGELESIADIWIDSTDQIHVFSRGRRVIFSSEYEAVATHRTLTPSHAHSVADADDTRLVVAAPQAEFPLHLIDESGSILSSFGEDLDEIYRADDRWSLFRWVALARNNNVWVAHFNRYRLELWDPIVQNRISRIERDVDWFQPWRQRQEDEPSPMMHGIRLDTDENVLWVLVNVGSQGESPETDRNSSRAQGHRPLEMDLSSVEQRFDSIIEALDPTSGEVLATYRSERRFVSWVGDYLYTVGEMDNPTGDYVIEVWEARLEGSGTASRSRQEP